MPKYTPASATLSDQLHADADRVVAELQRRLPACAGSALWAIGWPRPVTHFDELALALMLAPAAARLPRVLGVQPLADAEDSPRTALVRSTAAPGPAGAAALNSARAHCEWLTCRTQVDRLGVGVPALRDRRRCVLTAAACQGVAFSAGGRRRLRRHRGCQPIGRAAAEQSHARFQLRHHTGRSPCALDCGWRISACRPIWRWSRSPKPCRTPWSGCDPGADAELTSPPPPSVPPYFGAHIIKAPDPRAGVVAIGDEVSRGAWLIFCRRDPAAALADLRRVALEICDRLVDNDCVRSARRRGAARAAVAPHFGGRPAAGSAIRDMLGDNGAGGLLRQPRERLVVVAALAARGMAVAAETATAAARIAAGAAKALLPEGLAPLPKTAAAIAAGRGPVGLRGEGSMPGMVYT